MPPTSDAADWR